MDGVHVCKWWYDDWRWYVVSHIWSLAACSHCATTHYMYTQHYGAMVHSIHIHSYGTHHYVCVQLWMYVLIWSMDQYGVWAYLLMG